MKKKFNSYRNKNNIIDFLEEENNLPDRETQNDFGYLEVSVYHNVVNEPIENAKIDVSLLTVSGTYKETGLGRLVRSVTTGINGYAPIIKLPALNKLHYRQNREGKKLYNVFIQADGYHNAYIFDVQVYPNVTTSYRINLRHIYKHEEPGSLYEFILEPIIPDHY